MEREIRYIGPDLLPGIEAEIRSEAAAAYERQGMPRPARRGPDNGNAERMRVYELPEAWERV